MSLLRQLNDWLGHFHFHYCLQLLWRLLFSSLRPLELFEWTARELIWFYFIAFHLLVLVWSISLLLLLLFLANEYSIALRRWASALAPILRRAASSSAVSAPVLLCRELFVFLGRRPSVSVRIMDPQRICWALHRFFLLSRWFILVRPLLTSLPWRWSFNWVVTRLGSHFSHNWALL